MRAGAVGLTGIPASDGLSGHTPLSMTPMTMPRPAFSGPPTWPHSFLVAAVGPGWEVVEVRVDTPVVGPGEPSTVTVTSRCTSRTAGFVWSVLTWSRLSDAAKPFSAVVYEYSFG